MLFFLKNITLKIKELRVFNVMFFSVVFFLSWSMQTDAKTQRPCGVLAMEGKSKIVIVVEKKTQTLYVHTIEGNGITTWKTACSTGKEPGNKKTPDDLRTPEGVFFFDARLTGKKVPRGFGSLAFSIDYSCSSGEQPTDNCKTLFFYGVESGIKPMSTNGGIAVEKSTLENLHNDIVLEDTPIIVVEDSGDCVDDVNVTFIRDLDLFLAAWVKSLSEGTYHEFLDFYSSDYLPDMDWWNDWNMNRVEAGRIGLRLDCAISERSYFIDGDLYVALFRLTLISDGISKDLGIRKLVIRPEKNNYRIIDDKIRKIENGVPPQLAYVSRTICKTVDTDKKNQIRQDIPEVLESWKNAWASGDMETYAGFYSETFKSSGINKKAWIERKRKLGSVNSNIMITIENPKFQYRKNEIHVRFKETFKSSGHNSKGIKTLVFVQEKGDWKIISEKWVRK